MSYHGTQDGMRIYDTLEEVPDSIIESGQKFWVLDPPDELVQNGGMVLTHNSPLAGAAWVTIWLFMKIVLVTIIAVGMIYGLQQLGYVLQGRPGKKIDENMFESGDGSVWVRDPTTGEWSMVKGPRMDMIIWAIVAIALIVVVILVYLGYNKKKKEAGKSSKESKPKSS